VSEFRVDDKAWIIPFKGGPIDDTRYCCTEVTVVGPLQRHNRAIGGLAYTVRMHDGREFYATPKVLRRPIPPHELLEHESSAETVGGNADG
jgi:hypothetical protein